MNLAVASDHGGYPLKARVIEELRRANHQVSDLGTNSADPVDYPDYSRAVAEAVLSGGPGGVAPLDSAAVWRPVACPPKNPAPPPPPPPRIGSPPANASKTTTSTC